MQAIRHSETVLYVVGVFISRVANIALRGEWETVSRRCARRAKRGCHVCKLVCWLLDIVHPGHCDGVHLERMKRKIRELREFLWRDE